jgi:DNA mismatch repair protein MutS
MSSSNTLVHEYFELTTKYQSQYGKHTILLIQVGAFFEIYGLKDCKTGEIKGSQIQEVSQICQLNMSEKKVYIEKDGVTMSGFRDYSLEKYLPKITEGGYTAVVYTQEKTADNKFVRKLDAVYSPGTYVSYDMDSLLQITNNIMCIWFELTKSTPKRLLYGVSTVNIFTGESFLFEHDCDWHMNPTTFDELERFVSVYAPSEVLIISPFSGKEQEKIQQYCGIRTNMIHHYNSQDVTLEKIHNCEKQTYVHHMLTTFFGDSSMEICSEFSEYVIATQSMCFLLDFIQEHNPNLVRKIALPTFNNSSQRMVLANHTLLQLNIIDEHSVGKPHGHLSSVLSFLNKSVTAMGKRLFQHQLTNPTFNTEWLQTEYDMISMALATEPLVFLNTTRKQLQGIRDMEKNLRQLVLGKLYPNSLYQWYQSILIIRDIHINNSKNILLETYLAPNFSDGRRSSSKLAGFPKQSQIAEKNTTTIQIGDICNNIIVFLDKHLVIESCKTISTLQTFEDNIIKSGVSSVLDKKIQSREQSKSLFQGIRTYFTNLLKTQMKDPDVSEYIKIHETEKSGASLQITKKRGLFLKAAISEHLKKGHKHIEIDGFTFSLEDVKLVSASTSTDEITFPLLASIISSLCKIGTSIDQTITEVYNQVLRNFETNCFLDLENLSKYIAKLDVFQSKVYSAFHHNYCCPKIVPSDSDTSYVHVKEIRHVLIEHINQQELYVTNDLNLGNNDVIGMLLYGTNAVGKTSLIRAMGIAVIMAQSGMFVPCSEFMYQPFHSIYSRILSNDNLFKGLSTFVVEMSELRVILKMADHHSFILGDELASGTENESALSIFTAALLDLHHKGACHMFATHFHEMANFDEIKSLHRLAFRHLSVYYDREHDCLVYDRKLKEGQGSRTYGLEVCASLFMPQNFINTAFEIRNKYFPENKGEMSQPVTKYNAKKIRGKCEMCHNELATETHHLLPQRDANKQGFLGTFHKNHVANLASVCEKCHNTFHTDSTKTVVRMVRKKTTKGIKIVAP